METYFDKNMMEIRKGDLLRIDHFTGANNKKHFMYHVVVHNPKIDMLEIKSYNRDGNAGHYRLKNLCNNPQSAYFAAEIISSDFHEDWYERESAARKRRKQFRLTPPTTN